MSHGSDDLVRTALARHLDVDPEVVLPDHRLRTDLKLYPLDLVLIALRLERDGGSEFPMAWLDRIRTVGELSAITRAWIERSSGRSRALRRVVGGDAALPASGIPRVGKDSGGT